MQQNKNGLLIVDKPMGLSSFDVIREVRKLADIKKVGHAGTLDPKATGVLVVVLGRCTKLLQFVELDRKTYDFSIRLGEATETCDTEGKVVSRMSWEHLERDDVENVLSDYVGEIQQVPPVYSAIKVDGTRAHELARSGEDVDLDARAVDIHSLEVIDWQGPTLELRVQCGSGTYVRSLARDISRSLDTVGHATRIRRRRVGPFTLEHTTALEELTSDNFWSHLSDPLQMVDDLKHHQIDESKRESVKHGNRIWVTGQFEAEEYVAGHDAKNQLLAVLECTQTRDDDTAELWPRRVMI